MLFNISAEEEVLATALIHNTIKTRFIDRKLVTVPGCNAGFRDIHNSHFNGWALKCNDCHCRTPHITSANAANLHHFAFLNNQSKSGSKQVRVRTQVCNIGHLHALYNYHFIW
ncbi:hypothetical protein V8G54_019856 [Vigna mungo]|uniref:Uncharacterized protein n=1 Tax=Vigna mungo TaxID=3915 RepID=A0AAQ3NAN9_VIGMU